MAFPKEKHNDMQRNVTPDAFVGIQLQATREQTGPCTPGDTRTDRARARAREREREKRATAYKKAVRTTEIPIAYRARDVSLVQHPLELMAVPAPHRIIVIILWLTIILWHS